jgi:hypothetical protein
MTLELFFQRNKAQGRDEGMYVLANVATIYNVPKIGIKSARPSEVDKM